MDPFGVIDAFQPSFEITKPSVYDFRYEDEDTVSNEIEEFYSYVEMPQVGENYRAWQGSFNGGELRLCGRQVRAKMRPWA